MDAFRKLLEEMPPEEASARLADATRQIYALLEEEAQRLFITQMLGEPGTDKTLAMVHL